MSLDERMMLVIIIMIIMITMIMIVMIMILMIMILIISIVISKHWITLFGPYSKLICPPSVVYRFFATWYSQGDRRPFVVETVKADDKATLGMPPGTPQAF